MTYILSIDAGTTGVTLVLYNKEATVVAKEYTELHQYYPQSGWVEHDPEELIEKTTNGIKKILHSIDPKHVSAIGITNQRETVVIWNKKTGKPIAPAIVWQCRRTAERCAELRQQGLEKKIKEKTGLVCDPYFSATKIEWLLKNKAKNQNWEELLCGTIDSWLVWNLSKEKAHVTDPSNASRTMLFNIHTKRWDEELLSLFSVPRGLLPSVCQSSEIYGSLEIDAVHIPIACIVGDQQAALFGQCCFEKGTIKNTYGTGCFILLNTGENPVHSKNLLTTIAWTLENKTFYALEGSVFVAGAAVQWLRDGLKIIKDAQETEIMAKKSKDTSIIFVPALTGLGCPYWDPHARGMILGITRGTTQEDIVRAALEGIAFQVKDVIETMEKEAHLNIQELKADGGASVNDFLMQFQAEILDAKIIIPENKETTALGAAFFAGLAVGFWHDLHEIQQYRKIKKTYQQKIQLEKKEHLYRQWKDAVRCSQTWNTPL